MPPLVLAEYKSTYIKVIGECNFISDLRSCETFPYVFFIFTVIANFQNENTCVFKSVFYFESLCKLRGHLQLREENLGQQCSSTVVEMEAI